MRKKSSAVKMEGVLAGRKHRKVRQHSPNENDSHLIERPTHENVMTTTIQQADLIESIAAALQYISSTRSR